MNYQEIDSDGKIIERVTFRERTSRNPTRIEIFLDRDGTLRREWSGQFHFWHLSIPDNLYSVLSFVLYAFQDKKRQPVEYHSRGLQDGDVITIDGEQSFTVERTGYRKRELITHAGAGGDHHDEQAAQRVA